MTEAAIVQAAADLRLVLGQLVRRIRAESLVPLGQLAVLGLLDRDGPQCTSELAAAQLVRHQSMARTVAQLVQSGAIAQRRHPSDGRITQLSITTIGQEMLRDERERRIDWLTAAIGREIDVDDLPVLTQATAMLGRLAGVPVRQTARHA